MKKKLLILTFSFSVVFPFLRAQNFTDLQNGFPSLIGASVAWSDYDGDDDLDFALIGFSSFQAELGRIYRNDGGGAFTIIKNLEFPVSNGALSWGDFDHDGDPDLLVNGQGGLFSPAAVTMIYRNNGNDEFLPLSAGLPGVIGISRWMDYDGDGWHDIIMAGIGNSFTEDSIRLFHNDSTGEFTEVQINLPGYHASDISIVDFDVDGDMDFFLTGGTLSVSTFPVTRLYRNDGNAQFNQVAFPFINLSTGTTAWADYDHDGDPDVLYDGLDSTILNALTLIYRNDGMGQFTLIDANLPGSGEPGSVDWADIDGDGDLDILLGGPTTLLRNDGNNIYTDITPVDFQQGIPCSFVDMDNDGDEDILIVSASGGETGSSIHRNENITAVENAHQEYSSFAFPNPVVDVLTIHPGEKIIGNFNFRLMNVIGQEVTNQEIQHHEENVGKQIDLSFLHPGLYVYTIIQQGLIIQTGKVIVN
ncbi:MAG TPA: FG-GAP-like repeat-containing protein [Saprospiraceae bacterium]|nr:FG-GAP-like repeat-containing protein [Saprospiraceae bacterium]